MLFRSQFIELISSILSDKAQQKMSMDQTEQLHEDTIYSGGFANEKTVFKIAI